MRPAYDSTTPFISIMVNIELTSCGSKPVPLMISSTVGPLITLTISNTFSSSASRSGLISGSLFISTPISLMRSSIITSGTAPSLISRFVPMLD